MMKKTISLFLILELILLSSHTSIIIPFNAYSNTAECSQGKYFDTTLNRCVLKTDVVSTKNNANECDGLTGEEYKDCFDKNVDDELDKAEKSNDISKAGSVGSKANALIPSLVSIGAAYVIFSKKDILAKCGSTSAYLIMGAGVATLLGELLAQRGYKKKLKGMQDDYRSKMTDNTDINEEENVEIITQNQTLAFDYQIAQENARRSAHSDREKTYKLAFGLYSASIIAALVEQYQFGGAQYTCNLSGTSTSEFKHNPFKDYHFIHNLNSLEIAEIIFLKIINILPNTIAQTPTSLDTPNINLPEVKIPKADIPKPFEGYDPNQKFREVSRPIEETIENALKTPWVRAAIGGTLALYSKKIADDAAKNKKIASDRIKALEELRDSFVANGGAGFAMCKSEDRSNASKVNCYCYNEDGTKNQARNNSTICQNTWLTNGNLAATNYKQNSNQYSKSSQKACIKKGATLSPSCCSSTKEKGQCVKIKGNINIGPLGGLSSFNETLSDTGKFINGKLASGDLNGANYEKLAFSAQKNIDKIAKDKAKAPLIKKVKDLQHKLSTSLGAKVRKALKRGSINPSLTSSFGATPPSAEIKSPKEVLSDLKGSFESGKKAFGSYKSKPKVNMSDFDFGSTSDESGITIEDDVAGVMKKDFKIDDINSNSDHNIFKIISNRYHRSGLRRLFDKNGISKADSANDTDINEK